MAMTSGYRVSAQSVTMPLMPGWNWISCPTTDTLDFSTALGSFVPMQGDVVKSQWGQATYINGQWRGSISEFYPGYGYHYKSNRAMPVMITFNVEPSAPQVIVTTAEPTDITTNSATCGGSVTSSNGDYVSVTLRGICWSTNPNPTFNDNYVEVGNGIGSFSASMTDLTIGTTYYVRAFAVTANGTFYGDEKSFITRDGIPTLTTADISNITGITASCGGNITNNGGLYITARGVCWSLDPNPTIADSHSTDGEGVGDFISSLSNLSLNTTYYVRAYATTIVGTGYGEQKCFTTRNGIPTLTTADITEITGVTATCGGNITDDGGLNITTRGVCWSTLPNPTVADSLTIDGDGMGNFSSNITDLTVSTTYYVRAYATTAAGTAYGEQESFTTQDGIPILTTMNVTNISGTSAMSGGIINDDCGLGITARGICWSTSPNPTIEDIHNFNGTGNGSFISSIYGLTINTTYYIRAYASTEIGIGYGNEVSFTTDNDGGNTAPTGAINGLFSVSENHQVYFSQGNLQYQASTKTWRFAENQWDYVGDETLGTVYENGVKSDNSLISSTYDGWIDLFCWGTGDNPINEPHGYNLTFTDWGDNSISNGGNIAYQWYTLNDDGWSYLFNSRNTASGIRYTKALVNGVNGVILLPDDWDMTTYSLNNTNSNDANYNSNTISSIQWTSLENAGAVFLPAAGYRYGTGVPDVGSSGYYWSSSGYFNSYEWIHKYYFVNFNDNSLNTNGYNGPYFGQSVRLVRSAE